MTTPQGLISDYAGKMFLARIGTLLFAGLWAYWPTVEIMLNKWNNSPEYSHGYLVPIFSIALLWTRLDQLDLKKIGVNPWGLVLIAAALIMRSMAIRFYMEWFDLLSVIPFLAGVFLLAGGWHVSKWSATAVAFLIFMVPLPYSLEVALRGPLRKIGTVVSTYVMQTIGLPALAEGNVIVVGDARIGVTEACSGISMLMVFVAFSVAMALFIRERPIWEKILVLASAIPIAVFANVTRITVTGLLYATGFAEIADAFFHDFAGWMMIPLAFAVLWFELYLASKIIVVADDIPMVVGLNR